MTTLSVELARVEDSAGVARFWGLARTVVLAAFVATLAPAGSLGQSARLRPVHDPTQGRPSHVFHLPGIGGERRTDHQWADGLADGGAVLGGRGGVEIFDWTDGRRGLQALVAYDRNREQARQLASMLVDRRRHHPAEPIVVTAHSGGAGVAAWALEALPAGVTIDRLVLVAPALSPGYDLSPALARVSGRAIALFSPLDAMVLGTGTRVFGTIDRVNADAAGRVGFLTPGDDRAAPTTRRRDRATTRPTTQPTFADPAQYAKLVQVPYDPAWASLGNRGSHNGAMRREFVRRVVAPMLLAPAASE